MAVPKVCCVMSVVAITFTWWGGLSGWECTKVWPNKLGDGAGACQGEWVKKKDYYLG